MSYYIRRHYLSLREREREKEYNFIRECMSELKIKYEKLILYIKYIDLN